MSAWIDQKYMDIVSRYLTLSKKAGPNVVYARCPVCGDSMKNQYKRRFGITVKHDGAICGCFNCNYHAPLWKFLKEYYPDIYKDYQVESFLEKDQDKKKDQVFTEPVRSKLLFSPKSEQLKNVKPVTSIPDCVSYLERRAIPKSQWKKFIYVENFREFCDKLGYTKASELEEDARLVIAFFKNGEIIGVQGRSMMPNAKMRYITIRLSEETVMYTEGVDLSKDVFVFEGIYDAMMVSNGAGSLSSNLERVSAEIPKEMMILCFDNEPRNPNIVSGMKRGLLSDYRVFIPDRQMIYKDINEMVMQGVWTHQEAEDYIKQNTYTKTKGLLYLTQWKKV
jgi:hypothetical protein